MPWNAAAKALAKAGSVKLMKPESIKHKNCEANAPILASHSSPNLQHYLTTAMLSFDLKFSQLSPPTFVPRGCDPWGGKKSRNRSYTQTAVSVSNSLARRRCLRAETGVGQFIQ